RRGDAGGGRRRLRRRRRLPRLLSDGGGDARPRRRPRGDSRMRGHADVVALLNDVLTAELTAVNQYFVHARMCENWGYERLWKKIRAESIDEMKHADRLIERILY